MEPSFQSLGKYIIIAGIILVITGVLISFSGKLPFGKLPGDIHIKKENFSFYFPLMSSILLSIAVSVILYLVRKFF